MKRSIDNATPTTNKAGRFTTTQVLAMLDSDNENELVNDVDYPIPMRAMLFGMT